MIPIKYTIKSGLGRANIDKPVCWVIEGSNDNNSCEILHETKRDDYSVEKNTNILY